MPEIKKMDYRELLKEEPVKEAEMPEQVLLEDDKTSKANGLEAFWFGADRKTKIEAIVLTVIVVLTVSVFAFYFVQRLASDRGVVDQNFVPTEGMPPGEILP